MGEKKDPPENLDELKASGLTLAEAMDPRRRPLNMPLDLADSTLSNRVYEATALFEQLEGAGLVRGNGHHMRQEVCQFACDLLKERWTGPSDPNEN